jgi:ketosteroid isomerase-like protein
VSLLRCLLIGLLSVTIASCATTRSKKEATPLAVVENYLAALNRRDLLALTAYVEPNVVWYSSVKDERIQEVAGREVLVEQLRRYFAQHDETKWQIDQSIIAAQIVAVRERSTWRSSSAIGERVSVAVYEIHAGRIARITYFLDTD